MLRCSCLCGKPFVPPDCSHGGPLLSRAALSEQSLARCDLSFASFTTLPLVRSATQFPSVEDRQLMLNGLLLAADADRPLACSPRLVVSLLKQPGIARGATAICLALTIGCFWTSAGNFGASGSSRRPAPRKLPTVRCLALLLYRIPPPSSLPATAAGKFGIFEADVVKVAELQRPALRQAACCRECSTPLLRVRVCTFLL